MADAVEAVLNRIRQRVNDDTALQRRGRFVELTFVIGIDNDDYRVRIDCGRIDSIEPRTLATEGGQFSIRASWQHWQKFWEPIPARDYQDLFSMLPKRYAAIDGDMLPLMQNLQYFKDVLASGRVQRESIDA